MIYVIGHKNPDLDSIASAIALAEIKNRLEKERHIAVMTGEPTAEVSYVLKKFGTNLPPTISAKQISDRDRAILVDHNEEAHRLDNFDPSKIVGIVDHHYRISIGLNQPVDVLIRPWGACATIIFELAQQENVSLSTKTAKLLLAAILSDTLGLKSPTATAHDKKAVGKLKKLAKITDTNALTMEILKAKAGTGTLTPKQLVLNDHKVYNFSGRTVLIGQVETLDQEKIINQKGKILNAMVETKSEMKLDAVFLAVTNPISKNTKLLYPSKDEEDIINAAFEVEGIGGVADIGPRVSRKKEMVPEIEKAINQQSNGYQK